MTDHGNTRERWDTLGGEGEPTTDKSLPHSTYLTVREQMIDEHASAPPAKIVLTDRDFKPREDDPAVPGSRAYRERQQQQQQ